MCLNVYNSLYYSSCWKYILVARLCFLSARVHHIAQHFWGVNVLCFDWIKFCGHWAFSHALCLQSTKDSQEKKVSYYQHTNSTNLEMLGHTPFLFFSLGESTLALTSSPMQARRRNSSRPNKKQHSAVNLLTPEAKRKQWKHKRTRSVDLSLALDS